MNSERFEHDMYRDELAEQLRNTEDHSDRLSVLADRKRTQEYVSTAANHSFDRQVYQSETSLSDAVERSTTLGELKESLASGSFGIPNNFSGLDHREHLLKRIDMAEKLGNSSLLPELPVSERKS